MAQLVVRNLEDDIRNKLKERARKHGRSMEEEVRAILRSAVMSRKPPSAGLGSRLSALFGPLGFKGEFPELRGHPMEPPVFE